MPYIGSKPSTANFSDLNGAKLILDADADTSITADTDDQIDIEISGANDFKFSANAFNVLSGSTLTIDSGATIANSGTATGFGGSDPSSADGDTLGTASLEWSDLYLADGSVIYFGNDQEVTLTHNHDTSLTCNLMVAATTFEPTGDTAAGDNSALGYTSVLGAILTGQGSTNDVTLVNDADATVLSIPTGTTNVSIAGDLTLTGTTPTLTIGDAGTEDTSIVFDGNAQDYYIGLDDTDDDFKIGLGSAVGTTAHMVFDEAGAIRKPLQPAAHAIPASIQADIASGGEVEFVFGTEVLDQGGNFASNTFTAPLDGFYLFCNAVGISAVVSSAASHQSRLITSNRNYACSAGQQGITAGQGAHWPVSVITFMESGDTAVQRWQQASGDSTADGVIQGSWFSVCLIA